MGSPSSNLSHEDRCGWRTIPRSSAARRWCTPERCPHRMPRQRPSHNNKKQGPCQMSGRRLQDANGPQNGKRQFGTSNENVSEVEEMSKGRRTGITLQWKKAKKTSKEKEQIGSNGVVCLEWNSSSWVFALKTGQHTISKSTRMRANKKYQGMVLIFQY